MATLNDQQLEMCTTSKWDFSDLQALFINCTLKRSPERSHTQGLIDISKAIMEKNSVTVEVIRAVDHDIAYGVWPDMTQHGLGQRCVARYSRQGDEIRHPRHYLAHLAG